MPMRVQRYRNRTVVTYTKYGRGGRRRSGGFRSSRYRRRSTRSYGYRRRRY